MLFNSLNFLLFLPIVFCIYWAVNKKSLTLQNFLLLAASYFFYACWDWRFLFLLIFSTALDYFTGIKMYEAKTKAIKKWWFVLSVSINLGFLGIFKYYNFFAVSFAEAVSALGFQVNPGLIQIILPVGISFYTFHGLSYVIDIYKERITPERNIISYSLFVSFFPLLVAGPIERATHLLPQIKAKRVFNTALALEGVKQIVWGLFKKIVVADNCAFFANQLFEDSHKFSGPELWLGMLLFAFQIYGDFSGYSDIALGTSKLFGISLLKNFNFPYFAKDIADFWRRWHISLSSWFRDYLYVPLGGSRRGKARQVLNTFIIFLVSGFWHGANWTFLVWGGIHAMLFLPLLLANKNRDSLQQKSYSIRDVPKILLTFLFVCLAWVFFRADTLADGWQYITGLFNTQTLSIHFFYKNAKYGLLSAITFTAILFLITLEWKNITANRSEVRLSKAVTFILLAMLFFMGSFKNQMSFIYFQF